MRTQPASLIQRGFDGRALVRAKGEVSDPPVTAGGGLKHPALAPTPLPMSPRPPSGSVFVWTGHEVRMLREARRMSVREFAAHLGVSDRMVSKWEAGGRNIRPRPINQQALDTSLRQADPDARERFYAALASHPSVGEQAACSASGDQRLTYDVPPDLPPRSGNGSPSSAYPSSPWEVVVPISVSQNEAVVATAQRIATALGWLPGLQVGEVQVRRRNTARDR